MLRLSCDNSIFSGEVSMTNLDVGEVCFSEIKGALYTQQMPGGDCASFSLLRNVSNFD